MILESISAISCIEFTLNFAYFLYRVTIAFLKFEMNLLNNETVLKSLPKKGLPLSIVVLIAGTAMASAATLRPGDDLVAEVIKATDYVYSDSFDAAYNTAGAIVDTLPGKPFYNLIVASILHAEMTDGEDYSRKKELFRRLDLSKKFFQKWIEGNPGDPWGYFFLGTVHAYKAMLYGQTRSWLKSLIEGLKARGKFSRVIEMDPSLYDAYTGLGSYHYWSSVKLRKYLPFLPDNREQGLRELRIAMDSSSFSSKPAATGLAWALMEEGKFAEASRVGRELYEQTSGGRISLWILGGIGWRRGNLPVAIKYYSQLLESLQRAGDQNYYNLIFCRYRIGVCMFLMRDYRGAETEFQTLMSYKASKEVKNRHKKTFEKTREYMRKIKSILKNSGS